MTRHVIIDCSALIHALTSSSPIARSVRHRLLAFDTLAAPGLLDYEVTSALLGLVRGSKLSGPEADKAMTDFRALPITRHHGVALWPRIKELHHNLGTYDAHYVALAEALGAPLLTSDARIARSGAARCPVEVFT